MDQKQNSVKPMFDIIDSSLIRAQFIAKRDVSFSSYLRNQNPNHQSRYTPQITQIQSEESDQISIFDAAKYFSGIHDDQKDQQQSKHIPSLPPRLSSVSSSIDDNGSNYGGRSSSCTNNNYRTRSFHATPTASSEASWNSQTGLLANPPGSIGVSIAKNLSPNSSTNSTTSNMTPRWPRISTKWLITRRKCPCSGKKSVQVEERIESTTPRMVDLRRSTSSNGSSTNYISSSWYSPRQNSPKKVGTTIPLTTSPNVVIPPQEPKNTLNMNLIKNPSVINHQPNHNHNHNHLNGLNPKVAVGPVKSFGNHSEIITATATATVGGTNTSTTTNGFTFPILENKPVGVKKMFNVIADPPRDSLEVFQPRSQTSPKSRRASYEDDNAVLSDGSSDLFEIESFSTTYPCRDSMDEVVVPASSFNGNTLKRLGIVCRTSNVDDNDGLDEPMTPSVAPTECYAPSEVSVDWSVTTAEGFDRASLTNFSISASEIGLYAAMRRESERNNGCGGGGGGGGTGGGGGGGEDKKSSGNHKGGGGLLSCRCEKAVSVGPVPIKCSTEGGPPITARHVGGRPTQQPHVVAAHVNGRWK